MTPARRGSHSSQLLHLLDVLESRYHNEADPTLAERLRHDEPLDGLILTLLSQHTNDRNRDAAFARLKERYPIWEDAANAAPAAVEDAVRPAGLAPTKSGRILEILAIVRSDFGAYSLSSLRRRERDDAKSYLMSLPGVGEKTASCVLLFDLGMPAFPVDTHIARVCRRIGVEASTPEEICATLERDVPQIRYLGGHVNIIQHGRTICRARSPLCDECPAASLCQNKTP
ncbi:MAG: endonuclease III [Synergistaceae bacterium]|jgi:endonuclease-3|nr:endonuclease III [Synergistaceae bacterium]